MSYSLSQHEDRIRVLEAQVKRLTWLLENVYRVTGIPSPGEPPVTGVEADAAFAQLLASGNTIGAIKRYQELTGVGLAEAKVAVEALRR